MTFFGDAGPQVFAHRGGCDLGPENTIATFDLGMSQGADGLELDVHLSADGVVVVHHDKTLDRTTNATGLLAERTADELARVDAGYRWQRDGSYPHRGQGLGIPRLLDVLRRYRGVPIIIEMKVDTEDMGRAAADVVRAAGVAESVCFAGFGRHSARGARAAMPEVAASACTRETRLALYRSWARWPVRHVGYQTYQVPERAEAMRVVSPRFIRDAHRAGLRVQVWTIDDEADMRRLLSWGVDALITNRPGVAVRARDEHVGRRTPRSPSQVSR